MEVLTDSFDHERRLLNDEIESLKEREANLKNQLKILQKHLDDFRQSNQMSINTTAESTQSQTEIELSLRERIDKSEQELERIRGENYVVMDKFRKLLSEHHEKQFRLIRLEETLKNTEQ